MTTQIQSSQLTPGQMMGHWNLAVHSLQPFETDLSIKLIARMTAREKALLSPPLLAETYLDPEYQVLLTDSKREIAKVELLAVHKRIALLAAKKRRSSSDVENWESMPTATEELSQHQAANAALSYIQRMLLERQKEKRETSNLSSSTGSMHVIRLI